MSNIFSVARRVSCTVTARIVAEFVPQSFQRQGGRLNTIPPPKFSPFFGRKVISDRRTSEFLAHWLMRAEYALALYAVGHAIEQSRALYGGIAFVWSRLEIRRIMGSA